MEDLTAAMSLEQKVGQLLMLHAHGASIDDDREDVAAANRHLHGVETIGDVIGRYRPGGVIFVEHNPLDPPLAGVPTRNLASLDQVSALTAAMQAHVRDEHGLGLLIATDHEQGPVTRLPPPASRPPGGAELGATGDAALAEGIAERTGRELLDVGISLNLAPVADVNSNPDNPVIGSRAFGSDPDLVATMTAAQVRGYRRAGVAATAKHFPGHGAADVDSHDALPSVEIDGECWRTTHLPPFAAAIAAGVDAIMTAHLAAPALDPSRLPATLSRPLVEGLLRSEMGFEGVILTDSLWMEGVRRGRDDPEVAVAALRAGADILLMPPDPDRTVRALVAAVEGGGISEERLDRSVRRILRLKQRLGLTDRTSA